MSPHDHKTSAQKTNHSIHRPINTVFVLAFNRTKTSPSMRNFLQRTKSGLSIRNLSKQLSRRRIVPGKTNSKESTDSNDTSCTEESSSYADWCPSPIRPTSLESSKAHLRVQFSEPEDDKVYESNFILVKENSSSITSTDDEPNEKNDEVSCHLIWYQQDEIRRFKQETQDHARMIQDQDTESSEQSLENGWSRSLSNAYQGFDEARSVDQMNSIMDTVISIRPICVGLEKWIRESPTARSRQRKELCAALAVAQGEGASDRTLRRICREHSRSSRLFAHYLACCIQEA